jgi:bacillithiol biosynthesis deacetylase BshB1
MKLQILAIGAHPDDVELGAAGILIKHARKGQAVGIIDLTQGELGSRGTIASRYEEATNAAKVMGLAMRENLKLEDGYFVNNKESQLKLIQKIRKYRPEIVIGNAPEDRHPDHGKGFRIVEDACFLSGLVKIESYDENGNLQQPWRPKKVFHYIQDRHIEPDVIVDITDTFEAKMEAVKCYGTQFFGGENEFKFNPLTYISQPGFLESIEAKAKVMGHRIGAKYGEGLLMKGDFGIEDLDQIYLPNLA